MIPPEPLESSKPRKPLVKAVIASKAPRLSEQFTNLIETFSAHPVQLREILAVMHARAYTLLLMLLALPFCLPVPLPGFSAYRTLMDMTPGRVSDRLSTRLQL